MVVLSPPAKTGSVADGALDVEPVTAKRCRAFLIAQMCQNYFDNALVLNVDSEHALHALRPGHARYSGGDLPTPEAIGGKYAVVAGESDSGGMTASELSHL